MSPIVSSEAAAVLGDERLAQFVGQHVHESCQRRALDPFDDVGGVGQHVAVHLETDVLAGGAEMVEEDGVLLGCQHVAGHGIRWGRATHRRTERFSRRHLGGDAVRGMVGVRRDLDGQLPTRCQRPPPARHDADMVRNPLQAGVGEHEVVVAVRCPGCEIALLEAETWSGPLRRLRQHVRGRVDADHVGDLELARRTCRQLTGAAAEVDGPPDRSIALDETDEVPERLGALCGELAVLRGIPAVRLCR